MRLKNNTHGKDIVLEKRIDVRPGERVVYNSGIKYLLGKTEQAVIYPVHPSVTYARLPKRARYTGIDVVLYNPTKKTMMLYPGEVLATIEVNKPVTIHSKAKLVFDE